MIQKKFILLMLVSMGFVASCGIYKFSGVNIPPDVQTLTVGYFPNEASIVSPTLSQLFGEKMKDKFQGETRLYLVPENGDFQISGVIKDYHVSPVAVQGNTTSSKSRLTIGIKVEFVCEKHPEMNFTETLSRFQDFDAVNSFESVEQELINDITDQLVQEIFNKIALNW